MNAPGVPHGSGVSSGGTTARDLPRRVILLGSTGSIGTQTLEVIAHLNSLPAHAQINVVGLAAGRNADLLHAQARAFAVRDLALSESAATPDPHLRTGPDAAERLVKEVDADLVIAAMAGSAGLHATLAAVSLGRDIALANKETLVAAGAFIIPAARARGCRVLPIDSEHSAIWQALAGVNGNLCPPLTLGHEVSRLILTASGGPFRMRTLAEVYNAPPAQALKHPTWSMGSKVTLDSATLTNKALELVEAHWLFGLPHQRLSVLIHPQSIVHSIVELADGSQLAQLGTPDMRGPIQYALTHPARATASSRRLDWTTVGTLDFTPADESRFQALALARRVIAQGGTAGAVFNAASEEAGRLYLAGSPSVPFGRLVELAAEALDALGTHPASTTQDILSADAQARHFVRTRASSTKQ